MANSSKSTIPELRHSLVAGLPWQLHRTHPSELTIASSREPDEPIMRIGYASPGRSGMPAYQASTRAIGEFVMRAAHSHEALLGACRKAYRVLSGGDPALDGGATEEVPVEDALKMLQAVITLAEGPLPEMRAEVPVPVDVRKPFVYVPVMVAGVLEVLEGEQSQTGSDVEIKAWHEGYWTGSLWLSYRSSETPSPETGQCQRREINNVTHWLSKPSLPALPDDED